MTSAPGNSPRIPLPLLAIAFYLFSPLLIVFGAMSLFVNASHGFAMAVAVRSVLLATGGGMMLVACALTGMRTMLQRQTDVLLSARRDARSADGNG